MWYRVQQDDIHLKETVPEPVGLGTKDPVTPPREIVVVVRTVFVLWLCVFSLRETKMNQEMLQINDLVNCLDHSKQTICFNNTLLYVASL